MPENLLGASQDEILQYLFDFDSLDEIAESVSLNGYFPNEHVIVLPPMTDGRRTVVEGNRRVAALKILANDDVAQALQLTFENLPRLEGEFVVPAYEVADRDELAAYLGFRHINGIKTWSAGAKARFVWNRVHAAVGGGDSDPFFSVGRTIGSNSRGVRSSYLAYGVLKTAEDRLADPSSAKYVLRERFGVWLRLLGTRNVPGYVGLDLDARSFDEVQRNIDSLDYSAVGEVLADLTPSLDGTPAVLADSRSVTTYSDVLGNSRAHKVLRDSGKLAIAESVFVQSSFSRQLGELVGQANVLFEMLATQESASESDVLSSERLFSVARLIRASVHSLKEGDIDETD
ncbi:ParB/Srx family N-terminal domain-containing protein [Leifsonia shinshuensis]|uniref:ParB/Sulfiredoxin domain-containing protein n=1 Tax=Leifsonia shinshuensis TaxID=150026 RepID=A0A853CSZ5_9MICO|nr:ParB/Srx family N-terminal domain-containing protein [Leifsonia shinshuensis]NYJ23043.1 hypothetical protein [Leifsonia shinshuensis]